jgi:hypothetical protein
MHRVVSYREFENPEVVGTYRWYVVALLVALFHELATGQPSEIFPDI